MISHRAWTGHFWPPYSHNLKPLDYYCVWGYISGQLRRIQPESIALLQRAVDGVAGTTPEEMQRDVAETVRKSAEGCIKATGDPFERFVKLSWPNYRIHIYLEE